MLPYFAKSARASPELEEVLRDGLAGARNTLVCLGLPVADLADVAVKVVSVDAPQAILLVRASAQFAIFRALAAQALIFIAESAFAPVALIVLAGIVVLTNIDRDRVELNALGDLVIGVIAGTADDRLGLAVRAHLQTGVGPAHVSACGRAGPSSLKVVKLFE